VPIILAMTIMEKNAAEYGIENFPVDAPLEYDTVETTGVTSIALVADILDLPAAELTEINPSSLRGKVPEHYPLHVPKGSADQRVAAFQRIPANHLDDWRMHRVGAGETLAVIGKRYSVAPSNIVAVNRLESEQPEEGDRLLIPAVARPEAPVRKAASKTAAIHRRPVTTSGSASRRRAPAVSSARPAAKKPVAVVARNTN
jgi:hypothetical protein